MNLKNFKIDFKNKKRLIPQVLTISFIIFVFAYFSYNAQINMGNRGISFGYGFLSQEASFDITFSMIDYDGSYSYGRAFLVGLLNTLLVSDNWNYSLHNTWSNYWYWSFITKLFNSESCRMVCRDF